MPSNIPVEYYLTMSNEDTTVSFTGHISIDHSSILQKKSIDQPDFTIHKYSLVLFDFDSPALTSSNRNVIDKLVVPSIKFGSTIDIYGYTDRIGNPEYNQRLSLQRANSVRDHIRSKNRNVPINVYGLGNESEIFDNDSPIGRQLSRTVQIIVITPKN
jgi:outer membrane protein OmpA-like peptidoglycan-associated protein